MLLETTLTPFEKQKVIENAIWKGNNYSIFKGKGRNTSFPIGQQWSLYKHLNGTLMIDGALEYKASSLFCLSLWETEVKPLNYSQMTTIFQKNKEALLAFL